MDKTKVSWGFKAENSKKRVRRHTWTDSPEKEANPGKKKRHFSAEQESSSSKKHGHLFMEKELNPAKKKRHFSADQESSQVKKQRHFSLKQESIQVKKKRHFSAEQESSQAKKKVHFIAEKEANPARKQRHFSADQESSQVKKKRHFSAEQESSQVKKKRHFSAEQESSQAKKKSHLFAEQEANPAKKRHFSAGNAWSNNEPDLLGTIMSGMTSPREGVSQWEGQPGPNYYKELDRKKWSELGGKKWDSKGEDPIVCEETQNQYWSNDPLHLETPNTSSSNFDNNFLMSPRSAEQVKPVHKIRKAEVSDNLKVLGEREKLQAKARSINVSIDKSDGKKNAREEKDPTWIPRSEERKEERKSVKSQMKKLVHFSKEDRSEKGKAKMLKTTNAGGRIMKEIQNTVKETEKTAGDNKKKLPREMEGTKSYQSKSSYKGSRRLGSTRTHYRPDRAYDFGRNDMEINDLETPNDIFELARIV